MFSGLFTTLGYNLIGDSTGSTGFINSHNNDKVGFADSPLDPMLGPLQSNWWTDATMALLPGSSAIDAGAAFTDPFGNQLITTDQRGAARPRISPKSPTLPGGNGSDIGAFERQPTSWFGCGPGLWKVKLNHWAVTGYSPDQHSECLRRCAHRWSLPR